MDSLITAAARALAAGDPLSAMKRVALRDDPPALALRGIAMAQIGDLPKARELLRRAARAFGSKEPMARARCALAEAEIALVLRDLGGVMQSLGATRKILEAHEDRANAAHAACLDARRLLLIGHLDEAEQLLERLDFNALPVVSQSGYWLIVTGIAMRRIRAEPARKALDRARDIAGETGIAALMAEVERATLALEAPAARKFSEGHDALLGLAEVETLIASDMLIVDACRHILRLRATVISLAGRPVLFALVRALAEAWPGDVSRETLLARAFRAKQADESHRARLRVEIGRLRRIIGSLAALNATQKGFRLEPHGTERVAVLAPPIEGDHAEVLALLSDGEAWSSSALALTLDVSPRTVQRALEVLADQGKVEWFGHGPARRWITPNVPGFPTSLLLPAPLPRV